MLTKWQSFVTGKPRNYPEMWAKLAAVLNSVQTPAQYEAAWEYVHLWYSAVHGGMTFRQSLNLWFDLRIMANEVRLRVGA